MVETFAAEIGCDAFALPIPTFVPRRYRPGTHEHWCGHMAFANDLIGQFGPAVVVQLGTGESDLYFGLCQCIVNSSVDCVSYGIEEEHAGEFISYNQRFYNGFSYLLHSPPREAQRQFSDDSIDFLWIQCSRSYEAGLRSFEAWISKVKPGGMVLIPDIVVRRPDFSIWKLWEELQAIYPETFSFHHSGGLGLLRKPGGPSHDSRMADLLFHSKESVREQVRRHYALYAAYLERLLEEEDASVELPALERSSEQGAAGFNLRVSSETGVEASANLEWGAWSDVNVELPAGSLGAGLTVTPAETCCLIQVKALEVFQAESGRLLLKLETLEQLKLITPGRDVMLLPHESRFLLFCFGPDPRFVIEHGLRFSGAARIRLSLRVERELSPVRDLVDALLQRPDTDTAHEAELGALQKQLGEADVWHAQAAAAKASDQKRIKELEQLVTEATAQLDGYKEKSSQFELVISREKDRANAALRGLERCMTSLQSIEDSISWRLTAPLRLILKVFRVGPGK